MTDTMTKSLILFRHYQNMQYQINRTYQTGYTGQKPYFLDPFLGSFLHKLWELCIINYICMACYPSQNAEKHFLPS